MIFLFVSFMLFIIRLFSWIPGTDTMTFVIGIHFIIGMLFLLLLDKYTLVWQNIIRKANFKGVAFLLVGMVLLDTTGIWQNLIGIAIIVFLIWRYGRSKSGRSFKKILIDWLDNDKEQPILFFRRAKQFGGFYFGIFNQNLNCLRLCLNIA